MIDQTLSGYSLDGKDFQDSHTEMVLTRVSIFLVVFASICFSGMCQHSWSYNFINQKKRGIVCGGSQSSIVTYHCMKARTSRVAINLQPQMALAS